MDEIFRARISKAEGGEYVELPLPAAPQELWEVIDKLGLSEDKMPKCEAVRFGDSPEWRCSPNPPDVFQLNALAEKMAGFTDEQWTAFDGLLAMEEDSAGAPASLSRIIDLAEHTDCCQITAGIHNDWELGRFYAENGIIPGAKELPEQTFELLDFQWIGREMRRKEGGVFVPGGYVVRRSDVQEVSQTPDFEESMEEPEQDMGPTLSM